MATCCGALPMGVWTGAATCCLAMGVWAGAATCCRALAMGVWTGPLAMGVSTAAATCCGGELLKDLAAKATRLRDFFVVCSGEAEIIPLDLKDRRRGSGVEEMVTANSLSEKLIQRAAMVQDLGMIWMKSNDLECGDLLRAHTVLGSPVMSGPKAGLNRRRKGGSMIYMEKGVEEKVSRPKEDDRDLKRFRIQTMHVLGEQLLYVGERVREIPSTGRAQWGDFTRDGRYPLVMSK
eukprot:s426_g7.t1